MTETELELEQGTVMTEIEVETETETEIKIAGEGERETYSTPSHSIFPSSGTGYIKSFRMFQPQMSSKLMAAT